MRQAAGGAQKRNPLSLCPLAQQRVWHTAGAQLTSADWTDENVSKDRTYMLITNGL